MATAVRPAAVASGATNSQVLKQGEAIPDAHTWDQRLSRQRLRGIWFPTAG